VEGLAVTSKLHEDVVADIAKQAGNDYYILDLSTAEQISNEINGMAEDGTSKSTYTVYRQIFQYFLLLAILIFLGDLFFVWYKSKKSVMA
jgi:hypothetical protein